MSTPSESGDGSVSRAGRVRKKNSLLLEYESLDTKRKSFGPSVKSNTSQSQSKQPLGVKVATKEIFNNRQRRGPGRPKKFLESDGDVYSSSHKYEDSDTEMSFISRDEQAEGDGDDDSRSSSNSNTESSFAGRLKSQAQSTYMIEKSRKSAAVTKKLKASRKDKGCSRITAYMLWAKDQKEIFSKKYPNADIGSMSKKLSDLWATVPQNQKKLWKNRAMKMMKRQQHDGGDNIKNSTGRFFTNTVQSTVTYGTDSVKFKKSGGRPGRKPKFPREQLPESFHRSSPITQPKNTNLNSEQTTPRAHNSSSSDVIQSRLVEPVPVPSSSSKQAVPSTDPADAAAHLSLLGESLINIGEKLKNSQNQFVPGGSDVLLDSLVCAMGSVLCLTKQIPELKAVPQDKIERLMDNIAHFMPGT